jgi:uncharacterized protein (TIGR02246 family)
MVAILTATIAGPANADDEKAVRQVIADMIAAFNRHDPAPSLFTEDADYVNVQGMWLKGAAAIERGRKGRFETALKDAMITPLDVQIRFITPDVAIAHVTHEMRGMRGSDGTTLPPHRELSTRVFVKKKDGRWLLTAFQNTTVSLPD